MAYGYPTYMPQGQGMQQTPMPIQGGAEMNHMPIRQPQPYYAGDYGRDGSSQPLSRIGFSMDGEVQRMPREFDEDFRADEMSRRSGGGRMRGYGASNAVLPMDLKTA